MENKQVKIYTLTHPETNQIFYVGRTKMFLAYRLNGHMTHSFKSKNKRYNSIIKELREKNLSAIIDEVERCNHDDGLLLEGYWMHQFKAWGFDLVNHYCLIYRKPRHVKRLYKSHFVKNEIELIRELRRRRDCRIIAEQLGVSKELIRLYLNGRIMPEYIKEGIMNYYKLEEERIMKILKVA